MNGTPDQRRAHALAQAAVQHHSLEPILASDETVVATAEAFDAFLAGEQ